MLLNLHKKKWTDGLILKRFDTHSKTNEQTVQVPILLSFPLAVYRDDFCSCVDAFYLSISFVCS
jgi:26S proteasome regulatory subunit N11